jgi:hypothetical protein
LFPQIDVWNPQNKKNVNPQKMCGQKSIYNYFRYVLIILIINHGSVQVPRRDVAQEAERCDALLASCSRMAIPSGEEGPENPQTY